MSTLFNKTVSNKVIILFCIMVLIIFFLVPIFHVAKMQNNFNYFDKWKVCEDGREINDGHRIDLRYKTFHGVKKGETLSFSRKLSKNEDNPIMVFDTMNSVTTVTIDDKEIYSFGQKYVDNHKLLSFYRHRVSIPDDSKGKVITINCTAIIDNPAYTFGPVCVFKNNNPEIIWFDRSIISIFIGVVFIVMAFIRAFILIGIRISNQRLIKQFILTWILFLFGIYIFARAKVLQLLFFSPNFYGSIEYVVLMIVPIFIMLYFFELEKNIESKVVRSLYTLVLIGYTAVISLIFLLSFLKVFYFTELQTVVTIARIPIVVMLIILDIKLPKEEPELLGLRYDIDILRTFVIGYVFISLFFIIGTNEFCASYLELWKWRTFILPVFMITFISFILNNEFLQIKKMIDIENKANFLSRLVNYDALTGIHNRFAYEKKIEELEEAEENYCIINIDLNNLKFFNDNTGHSAGDELLRAFAECLDSMDKRFNGITSSYRVGGDEFIIVFDDVNIYTDIISEIKDRAKEKSVEISFAYGMAQRIEKDDFEEFTNLADSRMYANKKNMS